MGKKRDRHAKTPEQLYRRKMDLEARSYELVRAAFGQKAADAAFEIPDDDDEVAWQAVANEIGLPPEEP